jgi:hypothetical protein
MRGRARPAPSEHWFRRPASNGYRGGRYAQRWPEGQHCGPGTRADRQAATMEGPFPEAGPARRRLESIGTPIRQLSRAPEPTRSGQGGGRVGLFLRRPASSGRRAPSQQGVKDGVWTTWYERRPETPGRPLRERQGGRRNGTSWFETGHRKTDRHLQSRGAHGRHLWRGFFPDGQPDFEGYLRQDDLKHGRVETLHRIARPSKPIGGRVREEGGYTQRASKSGRWVTYSVNGLSPSAEGSYVCQGHPHRCSGPTTTTPV